LAPRSYVLVGSTVRYLSNFSAAPTSASVRNRRISRVAVRSGEGLLSDPIAGAQRGRRELLFMPHLRHSTTAARSF
jgi:hypothetical protein